jgi:hypothetical protein
MTYTCGTCGRAEAQAVADAKSLGLEKELERGIYTCCQIALWADEQALAWLEATQANGNGANGVIGIAEQYEPEAILVPIRLRQSQVPWYRSPGDRG